MIDPAKWVEEYRIADKTDHITFEYECDDEEFEKIKTAADILDMDLNEYINYALTIALKDYDESN